MYIGDFMSGSLNPINAFKVIKHKIEFRRSHPHYFDPDGLLTFCGPQRKWKDFIISKLCKTAK